MYDSPTDTIHTRNTLYMSSCVDDVLQTAHALSVCMCVCVCACVCVRVCVCVCVCVMLPYDVYRSLGISCIEMATGVYSHAHVMCASPRFLSFHCAVLSLR